MYQELRLLVTQRFDSRQSLNEWNRHGFEKIPNPKLSRFQVQDSARTSSVFPLFPVWSFLEMHFLITQSGSFLPSRIHSLNSAVAVNSASPEELITVSQESCMALMIKPTATTCMAISLLIYVSALLKSCLHYNVDGTRSQPFCIPFAKEIL